MTLAALIDAGVDLDSLNRAVGSLGLPGLRLRTAEVRKLGFRATQVNVESEPEHRQRHLRDILAMIEAGELERAASEGSRPAHLYVLGRGRGPRSRNGDRSRFISMRLAPPTRSPTLSARPSDWDLLGVDRIVASPVPTGVGQDQDRPRRMQHSRPRHGRIAPRHSAGEIDDRGRVDHAHRRRDSGHPGRFVRSAAGHENRADRLWGRASRISPSGRTSCGCWSAN